MKQVGRSSTAAAEGSGAAASRLAGRGGSTPECVAQLNWSESLGCSVLFGYACVRLYYLFKLSPQASSRLVGDGQPNNFCSSSSKALRTSIRMSLSATA